MPRAWLISVRLFISWPRSSLQRPTARNCDSMKHAKQSDYSGMIEDVDQRSGALHSTCPLGPWLASPVRGHQTNQQHEAQIRALQGRKPPINVLSSNSE